MLVDWWGGGRWEVGSVVVLVLVLVGRRGAVRTSDVCIEHAFEMDLNVHDHKNSKARRKSLPPASHAAVYHLPISAAMFRRLG